MIIGDPSKFSITWDVVDEWSTSSLKNGVLNIYIDFTLLGNRKNIVHEVGSNLKELVHHTQEHKKQSLNILPSNFATTDIEIYEYLSEYTFPVLDSGMATSWEYLAAPYSVYDEGDCLFLVRKAEMDSLYYGTGKVFKGVVNLASNQYEVTVKKAYSLFSQQL